MQHMFERSSDIQLSDLIILNVCDTRLILVPVIFLGVPQGFYF